jgi:hypothetical protein
MQQCQLITGVEQIAGEDAFDLLEVVLVVGVHLKPKFVYGLVHIETILVVSCVSMMR